MYVYLNINFIVLKIFLILSINIFWNLPILFFDELCMIMQFAVYLYDDIGGFMGRISTMQKLFGLCILLSLFPLAIEGML